MNLHKQRGLNLVWVAVLSGAVGILAVGTLVSMRQERNIFKEILHKASGGHLGAPAPAAAGGASVPPVVETKPGNTLRKCTINGKTVFSDTECAASQSAVVKSMETQGVVSPKAPPKKSSAPTSDPAIDKAIERQFN